MNRRAFITLLGGARRCRREVAHLTQLAAPPG